MNLVVDPGKLAVLDWKIDSYKIVSLWTVLRLNAKAFVSACIKLAGAHGFVSARKEPAAIPASAPRQTDLINLLGLPELQENLTQLELRETREAVNGLINMLEDGQSLFDEEVERRVWHILLRYQEDLESRFLMMIPAYRVEYYEMGGTFLGNEVIDKLGLPGLREDADEAGNCFAAGRYTACVFHLMRVMERCVQKMGRDLGVGEKTIIEKEWQVILNQIKAAAKAKWTSEKDPARIRCESTISHLESVKIAWRNPTTHPKATYTDRQAEQILQAVRVFTEDFSTL